MGWVYEVACYGTIQGEPYANIYHLWDGAQTKTPDNAADVFENNHLVDLAAKQVDDFTWNRIAVTPLDVGNLNNPINRIVSIAGSDAAEINSLGVHIWVKFVSDDNGFKSGGKLIGALSESAIASGALTGASLANWQTVFDDLLTDLSAAGFALAIYRPTLSTPGYPSISICSQTIVRGVSTNNRRIPPFQN